LLWVQHANVLFETRTADASTMRKPAMIPRIFATLTLVVFFLGGMTVADDAKSADAPPSKPEFDVVPLWPDRAPGAVGDTPADKPNLWTFLLDEVDQPTGAVVVIPGGGYSGRATDHEGLQIARWLNSIGLHAVVCNYRVRGAGGEGKGYGHPVPMLDAQRAIRLLRAKAGPWNIDPERIGVLGFSAGGHLASTVSTHFDAGDSTSADPANRQSCRPNFAVLCYPVIGFDKPYTHQGSQKNLLGESPDPLLVASLSNEGQVSSETPPTFLFHTTEDQAVPVENSIEYYLALKRRGVPAELHVFEKGKHGVGLAKSLPGASAWPKLCETWMREHNLLSQPATQ
jgi:acetyl esterase/lipase